MWCLIFSCADTLPAGFEAPDRPALERMAVPELVTSELGYEEFVVPNDVNVQFELREDRSLLVKLSAPIGTCRGMAPLRLAVQTQGLSTTVDVAGFGRKPPPPPEIACMQMVMKAEAEVELPSVPVGEWVTLEVRAGGTSQDWAFWGAEQTLEVYPDEDDPYHLLVPSPHTAVLRVGGRVDRERDGHEALEAYARARQWRPIGRTPMGVVVELPERDLALIPEPNRSTLLGELRPEVKVLLDGVGPNRRLNSE